MSDQGMLFLVLSICAIIITGVIVYVARELVNTLRKLDSVLTDTDSVLLDVKATTNDINSLRQGVKTGVLSFVSSYLDRNKAVQGGEDKNGTQR